MPLTRNPQLSASLKAKLILEASQRRSRHKDTSTTPSSDAPPVAAQAEVPEQFWRFDQQPGFKQVQVLRGAASHFGVADPFFKLHESTAGASTQIAGREYLNFASYNYLGLCGHPAVNAAASAAMARFGTSVSASRIVSGERPVHRGLERALATAYGVEGALVLVSGHATNVTVIGHLLGHRDLVLHDEFIHNSSLQGMVLSGAKRLPFPHNDWQALERLLIEHRRHYERVLVVVEGLYSMDGDYPDLPRFIELKQRHRAWLMVDEAHSFGVMGATGSGIREHFGLAGSEVDIWMGTLSKALAGCGGYIAGETALIDNLKHLAPGFLYSVGMPPPVAGAALAALELMQAEPERVARLQARGEFFLAQAKAAGLNTGTSAGLSIIPVITGSSLRAGQLSAALFDAGINVQPILYPAVPEHAARLRFFLSSEHTEAQIAQTIETLCRADTH